MTKKSKWSSVKINNQGGKVANELSLYSEYETVKAVGKSLLFWCTRPHHEHVIHIEEPVYGLPC
jgi:hypothetical protein